MVAMIMAWCAKSQPGFEGGTEPSDKTLGEYRLSAYSFTTSLTDKWAPTCSAFEHLRSNMLMLHIWAL